MPSRERAWKIRMSWVTVDVGRKGVGWLMLCGRGGGRYVTTIFVTYGMLLCTLHSRFPSFLFHVALSSCGRGGSIQQLSHHPDNIAERSVII